MNLLEGLNPKQQEVIKTTKGPLLVLAGAGSGKTKALTHRVAYLIADQNVKPENILAITFTNKAAKEMGTRVKNLLEGKYQLPTMGTFHSVCARILRFEGHFLGFSPGFVIFDEDDSLKLIKHCLKKLNLSDEKISPKTIKSNISSAKNELISPEQFAGYVSGYHAATITSVYELYQTELLKNNAMDFDDLIANVVKIFRQRKEILQKYQNLWQYLLIDEYQDTNEAQYVFAKLLAERNQNICVVGDDWQSIYSWRGANFRNILNFRRDWPEAKIIKLEQNYRSTKSILTAAQSVIEKNRERSEKVLWTDNPGGSLLNLYEARSEEDEAGFICREIQSLAATGYRPRDMAVFYRTNAQSRALEEQLLRYRIPYKIVGGVRFYERKEIKDVLAWLKLASGAGDWISFERSFSAVPSGIGSKTVAVLREYADAQKITIVGMQNINLGEVLSSRATHLLSDHFLKIKKIKNAANISVKKAIETAISVSGLKEYLDDGSFQNEERLENLKELLTVAEEYERLKNGLTLTDFLEEVALISDIDNYQEDAEGVTLMTVHTSKGLEYKVVFLVGLEENIFPHSRSQFDPTELEEERRLFYVALTRAKEMLYLVHSTSRLYFGSIQTNLPSRFLAEIPEPLLNLINTSGVPSKKVEIPEEQIPGGISVGDKIEHEHYGIGLVKATNDDEITVSFEGNEDKIFSIYYAPIKKV